MSAARLLTAVFLVAELSGCATGAPGIPDYFADELYQPNAEIRKVALVTDLAAPDIEGVDLGSTRGQGAVAGAGAGALAGADVLLSGSGGCTGSFCGAALLLLLPAFVLGGAVVGAASGHSADALAEAESNARAMLETGYLQAQVVERAQAYARDHVDLQFIRTPWADPETFAEEPSYAELSIEEFDTVLEVELVRLTLERTLEMEVRTRLVSVDNDTELSNAQYQFTSEARRLEEWMANGATPLEEGIARGLQMLAEDIVDETFLLFHPAAPTALLADQAATAGPVPYYVLKPEYPALDYCFFCEGPFSFRPHRALGNLEFVEVSSTRPTLRWERFPRVHDINRTDGQHHQISDVSYDLRVFEAGIPAGGPPVLVPAQQIYSVRDLREPYNRIERGLEPCTDYFWTVRARFKLDGRKRVTEWAGAFNVAGWREKPWNLRRGLNAYRFALEVKSPQWFYYPFKTPCERG